MSAFMEPHESAFVLGKRVRAADPDATHRGHGAHEMMVCRLPEWIKRQSLAFVRATGSLTASIVTFAAGGRDPHARAAASKEAAANIGLSNIGFG
jgi:hypothetical protein